MKCPLLQKSLGWCDGKPVYPGIRRRLYYIAKSMIVKWPTRKRLDNGAFEASYTGDFTLAADAKWRYIDIVVNNSGLTSEPKNVPPSQIQTNKLVAVHPGVGPEATEAANYINNSDNVYLAQDMEGSFRVLGSEMYQSKSTYNQDLGQGSSGTASSTINVEADDPTPAPFYSGKIEAEDGDFMADGSDVAQE